MGNKVKKRTEILGNFLRNYIYIYYEEENLTGLSHEITTEMKKGFWVFEKILTHNQALNSSHKNSNSNII
jgi:hypothetical protein